MGTNKSSYVEMSQRIGIHTGGIRPWHFSSSSIGDREQIISYLFFNGKGLIEKLDDLFDIYKELFGELNFSNHKRLVEIIRSAKADMEDSIVPHGNHYVLSRVKSYNSNLGRFDELTDGITYYRFLQDLLKRAENDPEEVAGQFMATASALFSHDNVLLNLTGEEKHYALFEKQIDALMDIFPDKASAPKDLQFSSGPGDEGFLTASTVQYVGKGANLYDLGFQYTGKFDVLKSLLGTSFLWDRVRVHGGAYGSSSTFDLYSGDFAFVSYRDPNLQETLDVYDEAADYLNQLDLSESELNKLIIGCVGHLDPPFTPDRKGTVSMIEHLTGRDHAMKQKHRDEMLSTNVADLKAFAPLFQEIKEKGKVCVLGNEEKIRDAEPVFKELVKVFE
jgi:Zn-dependent M16 (insulinase) family peptidase